MADMSNLDETDETIVLEKFRQLSPERRQELLDFMDFLASREKMTEWIKFDAWALNLAREKRFAYLTEEHVAGIISDYRGT